MVSDIGQRHAGEVRQIGFMDAHVQIVIGLHRERRHHFVHLAHRRFRVEVLIPMVPVGRNPPCRKVARQGELRGLVHDFEVVEVLLIREFVPKPYAVVEHSEHDVEPALRSTGLLEMESELIVMVSNESLLTPDLLPGLVERARILSGDTEGSAELRRLTQRESHTRREDHRTPVGGDLVIGHSAWTQVWSATSCEGEKARSVSPCGTELPIRLRSNKASIPDTGTNDDQLRFGKPNA